LPEKTVGWCPKQKSMLDGWPDALLCGEGDNKG